MHALGVRSQRVARGFPVPARERASWLRLAGRGDAIGRNRAPGIAAELALWAAAVALVSPLLLYAGRASMPLAGLYAIAAGIALALGLAGRQLHAVLLSDALTGRKSVARMVFGAGMMLLVVLLVLLGVVVALLLLFRGAKLGPGVGGFGG